MFIKNFNSINQDKIMMVDSKTREYLINNGFCELSYFEDRWAFLKTRELLNILKLYKSGGDNDE